MIKKFYVFIFFLFLIGCSKDEYSDFKDDNLKALILENLKLGEQPTNLKVRGFKSQFTRLSNSK